MDAFTVETFADNTTKRPIKKPVIWKNSFQFICCSIAFIIGFANIWRFPFMVLYNGGGTFIVCYIIVLIAFGIPMYYLESFLGQFTSSPSVNIFMSLGKGFSGIGWSQILLCLLVSTYYGVLTTYALFYFVQTFNPVFPWTHCKPEWGKRCINFGNLTDNATRKILSEKLYFFKEVLKMNNLENGIGTPDPIMVICSFFVWLINFMSLSRSIIWVGKASYVLALFPYVTIFIILGKIAYFKGAEIGIDYIFSINNWSVMSSLTIWYEAVAQCFISLCQGTGVITALASHNKFGYYSKVTSIGIVVADVATSVIFGATTFSVVGHISQKLNVTIQKVSNHGPALVFVSYTQVLSSIPHMAHIYSILFYLSIFFISIGSLMGVQLVIADQLHVFFPRMEYWQTTLFLNLFCFGVSVAYFTPGGIYLMEMVRVYGHKMIAEILIFCTLIAAVHVYGLQNVSWDVEYLTQSQFGYSWRIAWAIVDTTVILLVIIFELVSVGPLQMGDYVYPNAYQVIAWVIFGCVLLPIPLMMVLYIARTMHKSCGEALELAFNSDDWRPLEDDNYQEWRILKLEANDRLRNAGDSGIGKFFKSLFRAYD